MKNNISITLSKDYITMKIKEAEHQKIIEELKEKTAELKELYQEAKTPILVTGKILSNEEMEEIQKIIVNQIKVKVEFDSPKELGLHGIKKAYRKTTDISETKYYKGSLRSGQKIEFEGSVIIMGDLNGGAEVVAGENIVITGALRGLAHAGAKGNKSAIIAAQEVDTPQIRISNTVKEFIRGETYKNAYITLNEKDIIIEEPKI